MHVESNLSTTNVLYYAYLCQDLSHKHVKEIMEYNMGLVGQQLGLVSLCVEDLTARMDELHGLPDRLANQAADLEALFHRVECLDLTVQGIRAQLRNIEERLIEVRSVPTNSMNGAIDHDIEQNTWQLACTVEEISLAPAPLQSQVQSLPREKPLPPIHLQYG